VQDVKATAVLDSSKPTPDVEKLGLNLTVVRECSRCPNPCSRSSTRPAARRRCRSTEYCGAPDRHEDERYLAVEDIDHTRTKTKSPQTNGICERFHKTVLNEFYRMAFRKKHYRTLEELQADLDAWLQEYNERRPHQGRWCYGKTPMQTFLDSVPLAEEKLLRIA
jgi:hypothetical protein